MGEFTGRGSDAVSHARLYFVPTVTLDSANICWAILPHSLGEFATFLGQICTFRKPTNPYSARKIGKLAHKRFNRWRELNRGVGGVDFRDTA